jgi:hypothetical protein
MQEHVITRSKALVRAGVAMVLGAILAAFASFPVEADRHCLTAQEAYFGARNAIQDETRICSAALESAITALESAVDLARVCGCSELVQALETLVLESSDDTASCEARVANILDHGEEMVRLVSTCH